MALFEKQDERAEVDPPEKPNGEAEGKVAPEGNDPGDPKPDDGEDDEGKQPSLFAKPRKGEGKPLDERNFINHPRWQEMVGQRKEAISRAETAERARDEAQPFRDAILTHYGKIENPVEALNRDVRILEAWEQLAASDPMVRAAGDKVMALVSQMEGGGGGPTSRSAQAKSAPAAAPAEAAESKGPDPYVVRILERDARSTIESIAQESGFLKKWQTRLAEDLLREIRHEGGDALAKFDREDGERRARAWIQRGSYEEAELTGRQVRGGRARATLGSNGAPAGGSSAEAQEGRERPRGVKAVKNLREWEERHQGLVSGIGRSVGS